MERSTAYRPSSYSPPKSQVSSPLQSPLEMALPPSSSQVKQNLYIARERLVAVDARRGAIFAAFIEVEKERQSLTENYEGAQLAFDNECVLELERSKEESAKLREEIDALKRQFQQEKLALGHQIGSISTKVLEAEQRAANAEAAKEEICKSLMRATEDKMTAVHHMEQKVADAEESLAKSEATAEELRVSIMKLTADKFALWTKHDEVIDEAKAVTNLATKQWQSNDTAADCHLCTKPFSVFLRRHHCRVCGHIFCHDCSAYKVKLAMSDTPARVCNNCFAMFKSIRMSPARTLTMGSSSSVGVVNASPARSPEKSNEYFISDDKGAQGWSNGFATKTIQSSDTESETSSRKLAPIYDDNDDRSRSSSSYSKHSNLGSQNPATRMITSTRTSAPRMEETLEQKFNELALQAKLKNPDKPFLTSIESLYASCQRQGIPPEGWTAFIQQHVSQ